MTTENKASIKDEHDSSNTAETTKDQSNKDAEGDEDSVIEEGNEDEEESKGTLSSTDINPEVNEEDEEVRLAMEMALAAMKNPKMKPDELRKLVLSQNAEQKQQEFIKQVEEKKKQQKLKEQEEAQQRWNDQKDSMFSWLVGTPTEEQLWAQQKVRYADKIKNDQQVREARKAIKAKRKGLKALRLQGNRVETRHIFKRQRMEKHLLDVEESIDKHLRQFCHSKTFDATTYAKAMMKATKKWSKHNQTEQNKPSETDDQALALEAQLCRNMHQMLALEKQKSKLKKSLKEIKKYLQRCKSWLSDKQALCELHMLTLDATQTSMKTIYEDTLNRQDAFIHKILNENDKENARGAFAEDTFAKGSGLQALLANVPLDVSQKYDELPSHSGPGATLNALRGLPFRDSFTLSKAPSRDGKSGRDDATREDILASGDDNHGQNGRSTSPGSRSLRRRSGQKRELVIQTNDDASISSALSDPDEDLNGSGDGFAYGEQSISADSVSGKIAFGEDAPWLVEGGGSDPALQSPGNEKVHTKSAEKSFEKESMVGDNKKNSAKMNGSNGNHGGSEKNGTTTKANLANMKQIIQAEGQTSERAALVPDK